jgi:hypothetical protein
MRSALRILLAVRISMSLILTEKRARLGASRYVSQPVQLRCSGETKGETNRWLEMEPLVSPVLDQRLWQCRAAGG